MYILSWGPRYELFHYPVINKMMNYNTGNSVCIHCTLLSRASLWQTFRLSGKTLCLKLMHKICWKACLCDNVTKMDHYLTDQYLDVSPSSIKFPYVRKIDYITKIEFNLTDEYVAVSDSSSGYSYSFLGLANLEVGQWFSFLPVSQNTQAGGDSRSWPSS